MDELLKWLIGGGLLALIIFVLKSNKDNDTKVGRTYKRLDEVKRDFETKHVTKEVCGILNTQMSSDLKEIKTDVKLLLRKNGFKA